MECGQWRPAATLQTDLPVCPENQELPRDPLCTGQAQGLPWRARPGQRPQGSGSPMLAPGDQGAGTHVPWAGKPSPQGPGVFCFVFFVLFCFERFSPERWLDDHTELLLGWKRSDDE